MTERRETDRRRKTPRDDKPKFGPDAKGERIAKHLARAGIASRRACETLIAEGKVSVDGKTVGTPALKVTGREDIRVSGRKVEAPERTRLWRYHKPAGLITTTSDPAGRRAIYDELPKSLPRTVTIGRLDLNTEGLLLLTNDGALARAMELPGNEMVRTYRARAFGMVDENKLTALRDGLTVDGERFGTIDAVLEQETGANNWLRVSLTEGKKREVRRALDAVGLKVNRLIRISYGSFELGELQPGAVVEVPPDEVAAQLGRLIERRHRPKPEKRRPRRSRTPPKSRLGRRRG